jgi:GT2 family glycosyltransferase
MPPSLQIQTVLFKPSQGSVDRFLSSVAQAVTVARGSGSISSASLIVGDCSPLQVFQSAGLDGLARSLREAGLDDFRYEFFDANLGSAGGQNRLFEVGESDLVLILNPDVVASPQLIAELTLRLDDPKIGLVEGRQLPIEHPKPYDLASGETPWASTACALIPRKVIAEVGEFDAESFFLYCDDVDYSWRIRQAGYKIIFHPPARVFHDKRLDANGKLQVGSAEVFYAAEAALMMAHKWSRSDLVKQFLNGILEHGSPLQREAAESFLKRRKVGDLPDPIDPEHRVGEFHEGNWAKHRW